MRPIRTCIMHIISVRHPITQRFFFLDFVIGFLRSCTTNNWIKFQIKRKIIWNENSTRWLLLLLLPVRSFELAVVRVGIRQWRRIFCSHLFTGHSLQNHSILWNDCTRYSFNSGWYYFFPEWKRSPLRFSNSSNCMYTVFFLLLSFNSFVVLLSENQQISSLYFFHFISLAWSFDVLHFCALQTCA